MLKNLTHEITLKVRLRFDWKCVDGEENGAKVFLNLEIP